MDIFQNHIVLAIIVSLQFLQLPSNATALEKNMFDGQLHSAEEIFLNRYGYDASEHVQDPVYDDINLRRGMLFNPIKNLLETLAAIPSGLGIGQRWRDQNQSYSDEVDDNDDDDDDYENVNDASDDENIVDVDKKLLKKGKLFDYVRYKRELREMLLKILDKFIKEWKPKWLKGD